MNSIYHFFKDLVNNKELFKKVEKLENFPFDDSILSCKNVGIFPDLAISLNTDNSIFTGGELIELKDSISYSVSSFNSTIPTKRKNISKIITSENSNIFKQMKASGDDVYSLPDRDVFYLVRGKSKSNVKVCLVYGSFFETISVENLISDFFKQVIEDRLKDSDYQFSDEVTSFFNKLFSEQEAFSKVRNVEKSSVKLRFRIMTEVKAEGNILNSKKYPEIIDNTLNFLLPIYSKKDEDEIMKKFNLVFSLKEQEEFNIIKIKHHFNGYFLVFQINI
ncbi:MAG TPA: hypothetical protein PKY56_06600 [Candidatus Kapabacteria bacterium]|nr:hypothetical protein [Candidatus Kapabacteria bacterium]HPO63193.1 hypothetical protein [Candidatus Kapabacteria bacterium]